MTLLLIIGPPAVGKMAVGHEVAARTGLRLFHNHMSIEPLLRIFDYGTPPFWRLLGSFRRQVFEEVAASDLPGLIFTFVWDFDQPSERQTVDEYAAPFRERGAPIHYLELQATQAERLRRNGSEFRLAEKPSKRDLDWSDRGLVEMDEKYRMNTDGEFDDRADWWRVDNTDLPADVVAELAIDHFGLTRR